jgi:FAD/FMN-containing dehydrogenase
MAIDTHRGGALAEALTRSGFRGEVVHPEHPAYEETRKVHNGMIQKHPALVARCADAADVIRAVDFAQASGIELSVRGGGHNAGGLGLVDDGLAIDLSPMRNVRVDPAARTAQVGGGAVLGDVDHATHVFGLAVPTGIASTTGVGGLTLGGGLGHLTRRFGLTIDNLLAADVVLADGSFVTASEDEHEDLFWALRGGGGNFGVVTSFTFRLHEVSTVSFGPTLWPLERSQEVLGWYRDFLPAQPDELSGFFAFLSIPPGPPFPEELWLKECCGVVWCSTAGPERTAELLAPVRALEPLVDGVAEMPLPAAQSAFDELLVPGNQWYWKADFVEEISDEAIAIHAEWSSVMPTWMSTMHLYPIDGAASRVPGKATAWSYRDARWAMVIAGIDADPARAEALRDWASGYWDALHPHSMPGAYVNFMMDEGQERVRATYRDNYGRLAQIKRRYDPANVFHVNQNIQPAAED